VNYDSNFELIFVNDSTTYNPGQTLSAVIGFFDKADDLLYGIDLLIRFLCTSSESSPSFKLYLSKAYSTSVYDSTLSASASTVFASGWVAGTTSYLKWFDKELSVTLDSLETGRYYIHVITSNANVGQVCCFGTVSVSSAYESVKKIQRGYVALAANVSASIDVYPVIPEKTEIIINSTSGAVTESLLYNKLTLTDVSGIANKVSWQLKENT
jgi:hypothetical protein